MKLAGNNEIEGQSGKFRLTPDPILMSNLMVAIAGAHKPLLKHHTDGSSANNCKQVVSQGGTKGLL